MTLNKTLGFFDGIEASFRTASATYKILEELPLVGECGHLTCVGAFYNGIKRCLSFLSRLSRRCRFYSHYCTLFLLLISVTALSASFETTSMPPSGGRTASIVDSEGLRFCPTR